MLNLILGLSGTGKSYTVYSELKRLAEAGEYSVLIVPEQFSQNAEIRVYRLLGDRLSSFVTVCSFTSYAERALKQYGGSAIKTLSDAGRVVYVRRAMEAVKGELVCYASSRRSPSFCRLCADAISELKTAGAQPDALLQAADKTPFGDKLRELALIYKSYNTLLQNTALDPSDRIALAAAKPIEEELCVQHVFVDNFDGFTSPEYKLFEKLLQAKSCTVTLCCESLSDNFGGMSLTSPVKKTAARLRSLAARKNIVVSSPKVLKEDIRHSSSKAIASVARILTQETDIEKLSLEGEFYVNTYTSRFAEAKATAAHIARLAASGISYSEFAIICRDSDKYMAPLRRELSLFDIPFFADETSSVETTAPAVFLRCALEILKSGLSGESVLRLLKTGLCGICENDIACLENYAYTWSLTSREWRESFVKNPSGFKDITQDDIQQLQMLEELRMQIITKIDRFIGEAKGSDALGISRALYNLMNRFKADENTLTAADDLTKSGDDERAADLCRAWELVMGFLSEMPMLLDGCDVTAQEYDELLIILMQNAKIGVVPQTQDAVLITTADRMRLESPGYCFVLGVSEGEFPKTVGASGILTHADRDALVELGIDMPGGFENRMLLEQMFFYKAFSAPKYGLYVSYVPAQFGGGEPAAQLSVICNRLNPRKAELTDVQLASTQAAALDLLGENGCADNTLCATLIKAVSETGRYNAALDAINRAHNRTDFIIHDKSALRASLGNNLTLSPTRIEKWHNCRFSYFLEYVLRILPRKKAELSPLESGSLVHYVLENTLREAGDDFITLSRERLRELAYRITDEYVNEKMPDNSLRFERIISRIKESVVKLLAFVQAEQAQSSFKPVAFEEIIGEGGIRPIVYETQHGEKISVVGKIDRVDTMEREGKTYIRVVDYKTGSKKFTLSDVYCGINMQMLIYLFTLCKNGSDKYKNAYQAGVLYFLADPGPQTLPREKAKEPIKFETDGLLIEDPVILSAMDKEMKGVFIPVKIKNDGSLHKSTRLASLEKLGRIERHMESLLAEMAHKLYEGDIAARPLLIKEKRPCKLCDYRAVCLHEDGFNEQTAQIPEKLFDDLM